MKHDWWSDSDAPGFERVLVLGPPGAGKSTLARRLGDRLDQPVFHLDSHFWKPGWEMPTREEWIGTQRELIRSSETWIMDGNYDGTLEVRLPEADTLILLELSGWRSLLRVCKRRLQYHGEVRPDMAEGCPEKVDLEFLRYAWTFEAQELPIIERKIERYGENLQVVRVDATDHDEVDVFLDRVCERRANA